MLKKLLILGLILIVLVAKPASAEFTRESASQAINEAESVISEMQKMNFGVTYANDTLNEAGLLFAQERYMAAETVAKSVPGMKDKAVKISGLIDAAETRIYDLSSKGYDVSAAEALFNSGIVEFKIDNYVGSESAMNQVLSSLDEVEAKESAKKAGLSAESDIIPIILDNLWLIIILFLFVLIAGLRTKKMHEKRKAKNKTKGLEEERNILTGKIKEAQKKYFKDGTISKMEYETSLDKYNRHLDEIKNELYLIKDKKNVH